LITTYGFDIVVGNPTAQTSSRRASTFFPDYVVIAAVVVAIVNVTVATAKGLST
jgi:hypothetical protein